MWGSKILFCLIKNRVVQVTMKIWDPQTWRTSSPSMCHTAQQCLSVIPAHSRVHSIVSHLWASVAAPMLWNCFSGEISLLHFQRACKTECFKRDWLLKMIVLKGSWIWHLSPLHVCFNVVSRTALFKNALLLFLLLLVTYPLSETQIGL